VAAQSSGGPVRLQGWPVSTDALISGACGDVDCTLAPTHTDHNVLQFALDYLLSPRLTVTLKPEYVADSLTLVDVFASNFAPLPTLGRPSGSGRHSTSGWGDTSLLATYALLPPSAPVAIRVAGGVSAPTGASGRKLNGKTDYVSYALQSGSGTWDAIAGAAVETANGPIRAGTEVSGTKRLGTNHAGYRLGDRLQGDLWAGGDIAPWLTVIGRLRYEDQGRIKCTYRDHLEHDVPFTELQQVDYDVNGDGVVDSQDVDYVTVYRDADVPHAVASPEDLPSNYGGSELDAGVDVTVRATSGPFKGDRLSIAWLKPVAMRLNGYQLRPGATLSVKASIAL
jgi:hypothetical protein